jgi:hypothetical protein
MIRHMSLWSSAYYLFNNIMRYLSGYRRGKPLPRKPKQKESRNMPNEELKGLAYFKDSNGNWREHKSDIWIPFAGRLYRMHPFQPIVPRHLWPELERWTDSGTTSLAKA